MATFKQTLKHGLLKYPTIFPNPVNVLEHMFCVIGNGYEWKNGELVDRCSEVDFDNLTMKYPEERELDPEIERIHASVENKTGNKLKDKARLVQMKWIADNIDAVLEANPTNVYFGNAPHGHYFTKGICLAYAKAFHFPDNIKKDWAEALYEFCQYWLVQLNVEYGVSIKDNTLSWWPKDILEARKAILETRERLYPYAHDGQPYEQHVTQMKKIVDSLNLN